MDAVHRLIAILLLVFVQLDVIRAQPQELDLLVPVTGEIAAGEVAEWSFTGGEGGMLSFQLTTTDDDFDPVLTLVDRSGAVVDFNDDFRYPESRDALIQAVTLPRLDTYFVQVSGFGDTSGAYELVMLPGFADLAHQADFAGNSEWESDDDALLFEAADGQLALNMGELDERGIAVSAADSVADAYAHARVLEVDGRAGWTVGLVLRWQNARSYYLFNINDEGQYRFLEREPGGDRVLRDWVTHPAIVPGAISFTMGVLANGSGFEFFYDGQLIGRLNDSAILEAGGVGLAIETGRAPDAEMTARFDQLAVTTPLQHTEDGVIPARVAPGPANAMTPDLQRVRLIPTDGRTALQVPESFVTLNQPGVSRVTLAGGQTFETIAVGTRFTPTIQGQGTAGCGLLVGVTGEEDYTIAYLDRQGAYGISRRDGAGFEAGLYGEDEALAGGESHHMLLIVRADELLLFIDGLYRGRLEADTPPGAIANAVINFDPVTTSCDFTDTWVWNW